MNSQAWVFIVRIFRISIACDISEESEVADIEMENENFVNIPWIKDMEPYLHNSNIFSVQ